MSRCSPPWNLSKVLGRFHWCLTSERKDICCSAAVSKAQQPLLKWHKCNWQDDKNQEFLQTGPQVLDSRSPCWCHSAATTTWIFALQDDKVWGVVLFNQHGLFHEVSLHFNQLNKRSHMCRCDEDMPVHWHCTLCSSFTTQPVWLVVDWSALHECDKNKTCCQGGVHVEVEST